VRLQFVHLGIWVFVASVTQHCQPPMHTAPRQEKRHAR